MRAYRRNESVLGKRLATEVYGFGILVGRDRWKIMGWGYCRLIAE